VALAAARFVACSLDESGLMGDGGSMDGGFMDVLIHDAKPDVPPADNYVPPPCVQLDASCLTAFDRDAWAPVAVQIAPTAPCPEDFLTFERVTGPTPDPGACSCDPSCMVSGNWTCGGTIHVAASVGDASCAADTTFACAAKCQNLSKLFAGTQVNVGATAPTLGGAPTCNSNATGTGTASTTPVRVCEPACTSDYCGMKSKGWSLCILHNGPATCPTGFGLLPSITPGQVDVTANVSTTCDPCACTTDTPAPCAATFTTFPAQNCPLDASFGSYNADGTCNDNGLVSVRSIFYTPAMAPGATCTTTNPTGSGTASLAAPATVCCAP
jgi:hypothetical protein